MSIKDIIFKFNLGDIIIHRCAKIDYERSTEIMPATGIIITRRTEESIYGTILTYVYATSDGNVAAREVELELYETKN